VLRRATLLVEDGQHVTVGQPILVGTLDPKEVMRVMGAREVQRYLVNGVQGVYRQQGVPIHDKHIEVIVRQMLRKITVVDHGETTLLPGELVDFKKYQNMNREVVAEGKRPASGRPELMGITKASLATESWLSAASFQETTRVLTQAAMEGKSDPLLGLKENVIIGKLIPAGTGLAKYRNVVVEATEEAKSERYPNRIFASDGAYSDGDLSYVDFDSFSTDDFTPRTITERPLGNAPVLTDRGVSALTVGTEEVGALARTGGRKRVDRVAGGSAVRRGRGHLAWLAQPMLPVSVAWVGDMLRAARPPAEILPVANPSPRAAPRTGGHRLPRALPRPLVGRAHLDPGRAAVAGCGSAATAVTHAHRRADTVGADLLPLAHGRRAHDRLDPRRGGSDAGPIADASLRGQGFACDHPAPTRGVHAHRGRRLEEHTIPADSGSRASRAAWHPRRTAPGSRRTCGADP
jgi:hypothetical protein